MFTLDQVVPWGRSFDEYRRMFSLTEAELGRRIVGCGDGPASFNVEATRRGGCVTSVDPLYQWKKADIEERIAVTYDDMLEQTRRNAGGSSGTRFVLSSNSVRSGRRRCKTFWKTTTSVGSRADM